MRGHRYLIAVGVVAVALLAGACDADVNDALPPYDPDNAQIVALEQELAEANSRWLASVATSARYSPTISRLLAVDALRRAQTPEAWRAMGSLLFTDPRRPYDGVDIAHGAAVTEVAFSPSGALIATGDGAGTVRLIELTSTEVTALERHSDAVTGVEFAADGGWLVSGSRDGTVQRWRVADGELSADGLSFAHSEQVNDIAISASGQMIASASHDGTAQLEGPDGAVVLEHEGPVWAVDIRPQGDVVLTGSSTPDGGRSTLWRTDGTEIASFEHDGPPSGVAFSPDGNWAFAAGEGPVTHLIDVEAGASAATPSAGAGNSGVAWRPDNAEVASFSLGGAHRVLAGSGTSLGRFDQAGGERGIAYSPDSRWAVVGSGDFAFSFGVVGVWDLGSIVRVAEVNARGPIEAVRVSPDGRWIAAGYRFADGAEVNGGLLLVPGRDQWLDLACDGHDGLIEASRWAELVGPGEPFVPGCPGVEPPPPPPDVSTPDVSTP